MIYSQQVIADGASNYWRLNESSGLVAVDIIGGKNGTISGGVTLGQTGAVTEDKSMLFDGTTGKILTAASVTLTAQVTVEGWIRSTMNPAYQTLLSNRQVTSAAGNLFIGVDGTGRPVVIGFASGAATGARVVTDGVWHHVVYIANGSTLAVYVDGVLDLTPSFIRGTTFAGVTGIGIDPQTSGSFWLGSLDEVAIYPFALTGAQISNHYSLRNSTSVGVVPLISPGPVTPLIQNVVYALPTAKCQLLSEVVCQTSSNLTGPFADLTGSSTESGKLTQGGFVRCATGNTNIVVKKHTVQKAAESKYASTVKYDGASNYWRLGETSGTTAVDIIGGKNGAITGGVTLNQTGATNDGDKAMGFDGLSGMKIKTAANITMPAVSTLELWLKHAGPGSQHTLFGLRPEATLQVAWTNVGSKLQVYTGTFITSTVGWTDTNWHHVVIVLSGSATSIYFDGTLDSTTAQSFVVSTAPARIGCDEPDIAVPNGWFGALDEVAIYPVALSPAQIQNHYKLSAYSTSKYSALVVADGASNYWKLNELSGTSAIDMIGGKNGTISGGVSLGQAGAMNDSKGMTFDMTGTISTGFFNLPSPMSVEGWFRNTVINTAGNIGMLLQNTEGSLWFVVNNQTNGAVFCYDGAVTAAPTTYVDSQWHHVVFTRDGTTNQIYIDGAQVVSGPQTVVSSTAGVVIGLKLGGSLDDVAIYPRALTPSQILAHYNAR